jgi:hypothetical protein
VKIRVSLATLIVFLASSASSFALKPHYDLPGNDYLPKEKFITKFSASLPVDYRVIPVSIRLVKWSEYLGMKDSQRNIAPNRMIWEVLKTYCRPSSNGETRYYFDAVDAVTSERLVKRHVQQTRDISSVSRWAAKNVHCKFPGSE